MPADPPHTDPEDRDPTEARLQSRSDGGAVSIWLILVLIAMLAGVIYVISAL